MNKMKIKMKNYHHFLGALLLLLLTSISSNAQDLVCKAQVTAIADGNNLVTVDASDLIDSAVIPGLEIQIRDAVTNALLFSGLDEVSFATTISTNYVFFVEDTNSINSCSGNLLVVNQNCADTLFLDLTNDVGIDKLSVDVVALNSQNLSSLQFTLVYDADKILINEMLEGVLPNPPLYNEIAPGVVNVLFANPMGGFTNFPGGSTLFTVEFDVLENGDSDLFINNLSDVTGDGVADGIIAEGGDENSEFICINSSSASLSANGAKVEGYLTRNDDLTCSGANSVGLKDWIIEVSNGQENYFTSTDENGYYKRIVLPGDYTVIAHPYSYMWGLCSNNESISLPNVGDQTTQDFVAKADILCPLMQVDLSAPFLRRCFESTYFLEYCNQGTQDASGAYIEVELDEDLSFVGSTFPNSQDGQLITFDLANVGLECGTISFQVEVSCDIELGKTHCSVAEIFPQDPCGGILLGWEGPVLEVNAACDGDSVKFVVENIAPVNMNIPTSFIIVEDDVMTQTGSLILDALESEEFSYANNGSTFIFNAMQQDGFPFDEFATAFIEGCGTDDNGNISVGFINDYGLGDYLPYQDFDCQENIGSFDPNDKSTVPEGYGDDHFVKNNQFLDYKIRFQNTGTDTAFRVVIIDTLSELLDLTSFKVKGASHPFEMQISNREIQFVFNNILLPDSTTNETASHGFVSFEIDMVDDLADGEVIENFADIYFDFNDPIRTNVTFLEIGTDFIIDNSTSGDDDLEFLIESMHPNPVSKKGTLFIDSGDHDYQSIEIYNVLGQRIIVEKASDSIDLSQYDIKEGSYIVRLITSKKKVFSSKLIVQ